MSVGEANSLLKYFETLFSLLHVFAASQNMRAVCLDSIFGVIWHIRHLMCFRSVSRFINESPVESNFFLNYNLLTL